MSKVVLDSIVVIKVQNKFLKTLKRVVFVFLNVKKRLQMFIACLIAEVALQYLTIC